MADPTGQPAPDPNPTKPQPDPNGDTFISEAKNFVKNPLGIIGLFIVLVYAAASTVAGTAMKDSLDNQNMMTWFIVFFPVLILGVFTYLVMKHHLKLYGPGDFTDQEKWLKLQEIIYDLDKEQQPMNAANRAPNTPDVRQQKLDQAKSIINGVLRERLLRGNKMN